jgi:hypothetical protein
MQSFLRRRLTESGCPDRAHGPAAVPLPADDIRLRLKYLIAERPGGSLLPTRLGRPKFALMRRCDDRGSTALPGMVVALLQQQRSGVQNQNWGLKP